jgi:hypothetical protein
MSTREDGGSEKRAKDGTSSGESCSELIRDIVETTVRLCFCHDVGGFKGSDGRFIFSVDCDGWTFASAEYERERECGWEREGRGTV